MIAPGQTSRPDFPRFGLPRYATRFPSRPSSRALSVTVPGAAPFTLADALSGLPRTTLRADFHCVSTWSRLGLVWGGVRFADLFERRLAPATSDRGGIVDALLQGQDGYRTTLPLDDLLADDVLIADELDGRPLDIAHGAPLRLVAPRHYGYKSLKHLSAIELRTSARPVKHGPLAFLDHPRARVALEERGRWFPGWLLRRLYRPMIPGTAARFRAALIEHERRSSRP